MEKYAGNFVPQAGGLGSTQEDYQKEFMQKYAGNYAPTAGGKGPQEDYQKEFMKKYADKSSSQTTGTNKDNCKNSFMGKPASKPVETARLGPLETAGQQSPSQVADDEISSEKADIAAQKGINSAAPSSSSIKFQRLRSLLVAIGAVITVALAVQGLRRRRRRREEVEMEQNSYMSLAESCHAGEIA
jgi:hypothetical protein